MMMLLMNLLIYTSEGDALLAPEERSHPQKQQMKVLCLHVWSFPWRIRETRERSLKKCLRRRLWAGMPTQHHSIPKNWTMEDECSPPPPIEPRTERGGERVSELPSMHVCTIL